MTSSKVKKNKSVKTLIKEMRTKKTIDSLIPEAIEALKIESDADYTLINGRLDAKWRKAKRIFRNALTILAMFIAGYIYAKR